MARCGFDAGRIAKRKLRPYLKTGKLIWSQRLGTSLGSGPFGIGMPFALAMGTPNHGGALVTESGLVFIGAAKDNILRAYDLYTGETVWSYELLGGGDSAPISYMLNGRQYIAVHAGGSYAVQSRMSTKMIAFALPETTAPNPALR